MSGRVGRVVATAALALAAAACPGRPPELAGPRAVAPGAPCEGGPCHAAEGLLRAATGFGNVRQELILDATTTLEPGRGVARDALGRYAVLPRTCAEPRAVEGSGADAAAKAAASTHAATAGATRATAGGAAGQDLDYTFVGVAVDDVLVGADAPLAPWLAVSATGKRHVVSLVALAFVRDDAPSAFVATPDVAYDGSACSCGRATHFVGARKVGGLLRYDLELREGDAGVSAFELVRAKVSARDARLVRTVVGGLEVDGLDAVLEGKAGASPRLRVEKPVPIAYAVYPVEDVCSFAFPEPELSPPAVDFGTVPAGSTVSRVVHVKNRAPFDLYATVDDRTFVVPALSTGDVVLAHAVGEGSPACVERASEATVRFVPRDSALPVSPRERSTAVPVRARGGDASTTVRERVDTGEARGQDWSLAERTLACPKGYEPASCRAARAECGGRPCEGSGYRLVAERTATGCHFACEGPRGVTGWIAAGSCRYEAVAECALACAP